MRFLKILAIAAVMNPLVAQAQVGDQARAYGALERTVLGQMEAFRDGDLTAAFEFASDDIQRYFGSPEVFGMMVARGFSMVVDPEDVTFLDNRPEGRSVWQKVLVKSKSGESFVLDYELVPDSEGWKINAVLPVPATGLSA
ncbi:MULTISPECIES: DUF4864 domain-containing protein [Falsihalocynthiibacter]|uniref:DUF4864 domain-containing protein n=1 Tax=Falsihalocynthiibacter TaxID=2854182 RepID=UPI003002384D